MNKAFKYKLNPTMKQQQQLLQAMGNARFIYNWGLDKKKNAWANNKQRLSYCELSAMITEMKKLPEYQWLSLCGRQCLTQSLRNLDNAFTRFFKKQTKFPNFKSKHSKQTVKFSDKPTMDFDNWKIKIPTIGWVKMKKNRTFDSNNVKFGTLTVHYDNKGVFWCIVLVDDQQTPPQKANVVDETTVGIDFGIKTYATLSDGTKIDNPKYLESTDRKLRLLNRRLARKQKGSKNWERARIRLVKYHEKIANKRVDFTNKLSTEWIRRYDTICMEDLNITGMTQNHNLARAINSASWSMIVRKIVYKAEWYGKNVVFIGRFDPSSKMCSKCGYINKELKLSDREWICPVCGEIHDRDVNAAINIKNFGLHPQALVGKENKIPQERGILNVEGNEITNPMKH
jgi:putative transposase